MRFTLGRVVHFYYSTIFILIIGLFAFGAKSGFDNGILNIEYVSSLYDGTSKVRAVKNRGDLEEIKKFVDGDRIKDAIRIYDRLEQDIRDLKSIRPSDKNTFEENIKRVRVGLNNLLAARELTSILNSLSSKITTFENFAVEKKWPTLTKMSTNLRIKVSPGRLMQAGLYNFEKTQLLSQSVNNDIEALINFTSSSGLPADIKIAINNRIQGIKAEAATLETYVEEHKKFNRTYLDFAKDYQVWFKYIEPEIALRKIQFEKSSQTISYYLIVIFVALLAFLIMGFVIYNYSVKVGSRKTEKLILDTIKDGILPNDLKLKKSFSLEFINEIDKYRDYIHKRMSFGGIFQEAMPFASILLDSNLNLVWANSHFYQQWQLQNFSQDGDESLSWDFLQRFTNLEDNSAILNALRMNTSGVYKIAVKNAGKASSSPIPYEMHVSPVEHLTQKRIMVIFYPMIENEKQLNLQKVTILKPLIAAISAHAQESMTTDLYHKLKADAEKAQVLELYNSFSQLIEKNISKKIELNSEIEKMETELQEQRNTIFEIRKSLVGSFETQRGSIDKYNHLKKSVSMVLDARDQLEDQFKYALVSSGELYKDQDKILMTAVGAEKMVDDYVKSLKTITVLKSEFKEMKNNVEDFRSRIVQVLDQLLIFQNHEDDTLKIDQFLGKIKLEMKGFEKVVNDFNKVVTQLDITVTKIDMMLESRQKIDFGPVRLRLDGLKNNLENAQFAVSKISQNAHAKDDEMVAILKSLVLNLKNEMKRIDDMCKLTGLTSDYLKLISSDSPGENWV